MLTLKIKEEIQRQQWAMSLPSLRAMLAIVDRDSYTADDYSFFHARAAEEKVSMANGFGTSKEGSLYTSIKSNVGFLMVDGPIIPRATWFSNISGMVSLDRLTAEFKALESDASVDKIVFLLDSPGGAVTGVSDFAALVKASEKETFGFAWMAASAAYWIGSAVDTLVTPDTGMVGSIGTVLSLTDYSEADAKKGVKNIDIVSSQSPNKRPNIATEEGKAVLQSLVDELSEVFVSTVAANRDVSEEDVLSKFGGGAMFVAKRALGAGMIDAIEDVESFTNSLVKGDFNVLPGFSTSAIAETTAEEIIMDNDKLKALTAQELREKCPTAVGEIVTASATSERNRLQGIEALASKFDNALPSVKAAAVKVINKEKYDPESTTETVAVLVLDAVTSAQATAVDEFGGERRTSAETAAAASTPTPSTDSAEGEAEASEQRVIGLINARKNEQGE